MITQELLKRMFNYDPDGWLIDKEFNPHRRPRKPDIEMKAYRFMNVNGKDFLLHRLIWCWHHGSLPAVLDHADGNRLNNRIENLRECTQRQNLMNRKVKTNSKTGFKGINHRKAGSRSNKVDKFEVTVGAKYVGFFNTLEEAASAYDREAEIQFGEFARLNLHKEKV